MRPPVFVSSHRERRDGMNQAIEELELTEPYLAEWLSSVGLGVEYVRAEGNTRYYRGDDDEEIPVRLRWRLRIGDTRAQ
jgi:hypothetical protein